MHAFLLVGDNQEKITKKLAELVNSKKSFRLTVEKIDQARELKKMVTILSDHALIISGLENASTEAQNALLKTFEEPYADLVFIILCKNLNHILPTIVSRCQLINVGSENFKEDVSELEDFVKTNLSGKFETIQKITDRNEALHFVEKLASYLRTQMLAKNTEDGFTHALKAALYAHKCLAANTNVNLTLSILAIEITDQETPKSHKSSL